MGSWVPSIEKWNKAPVHFLSHILSSQKLSTQSACCTSCLSWKYTDGHGQVPNTTNVTQCNGREIAFHGSQVLNHISYDGWKSVLSLDKMNHNNTLNIMYHPFLVNDSCFVQNALIYHVKNVRLRPALH